MPAVAENKTQNSPEPESQSIDALQVENLHFTYPPRRKQPAHKALNGVSLIVPAGNAIALLGPNGSGKSTLMKIISGILPPDSGSVHAFGSSRIDEIRRILGVVFQSEGLDPHMTVRENLRDQASLYGITGSQCRHIIDEELEKAGISDRHGELVKTLSKGLARRVDLCRALLHKPKLLILDEPTVGLDPSARESFLETLKIRHLEEGLTLLMSTHLIDEADRMERVVFMHKGKIVADDSPTALRDQVGCRRVTVYDGSWTPPASDAGEWTQTGNGWWRPLKDDQDQASRMASELIHTNVPYSIAPPTLADVFEQLTGVRLGEDEPGEHS
ncbi:MAG: ABC transporter ATP-binding protein [Planctomycetes bacterium]|nr:ABC transporter ATP-binding protein [Planctomycetota bacterium]MCH7601349.1 ABC transporter ATP-binding protein [Planctomycetota bacterium]